MSQPWWDVLGIPRDSDRAAKRRAYAARLKLTNPEDDPAGFMALRQAYEAALTWVEYDDEWDEDWVEDDAPVPDPLVRPASPMQPAPEAASAPDPFEQARAAEHDELRGWVVALEAGLHGPWFKGPAELEALLTRILAAPAMIELETRDRVEYWLAELLADTVPRSDAILRQAIDAFGWEQEGERPDAVWRVLGRIDEWRLIQSLTGGNHELGGGWRALTCKDEPVWQRRIGALRPGVAAQVQQLFDLSGYQAPGIVHSFDPQAADWWRDHLARPRFGAVDLAVLSIGAIAALIFVTPAGPPALRFGTAAMALLLAIAFPLVRLRIVAPWRARRDEDYRPVGWLDHGWIGLWSAALLQLIWIPAGSWMAGAVVTLCSVATLWMAVVAAREPRIGNPVWPLISFGALALLGGVAFFAMPGAAQAALAAFAIASLLIAIAAPHAVAELLWRVGGKPVLAASTAALLLLAAAAIRMALPSPPAPLMLWGSAAIAGMMLMHAVRDVHDGSPAPRFAPLLRWALWIALVLSAIFSTPDDRSGAPPIAVSQADPLARLEASEPGFTSLRLTNAALFKQIAAVTDRQAKGDLDATQAMREIDALVNAAYRERLPKAPAALIAAEMDIRLATMREQQRRDPASCASEKASAGFKPSDALRQRHYRHALAVAGSAPAMPANLREGSAVGMDRLMRAAAGGDAARAAALSQALAGKDAKAKCAAQIATLEALTAQPDADVAKTMRPALVERAAGNSEKR